MNDAFRQQIIQKAWDCWDTNQSFQAGRVIFECIPVNLRHAWSYEILNFAYPHFPRDPKIETVLDFAKHPENWGQGKDGRELEAHCIVRNVNGYGQDDLIFRLAAQVGKIVYTAQQYPAPFDHSAGYKVAEVLKQIVQQVNDQGFGTNAWSTLANEDFILLEEAVMCHPACPTCIANGLTPINKKISQRFVQKGES